MNTIVSTIKIIFIIIIIIIIFCNDYYYYHHYYYYYYYYYYYFRKLSSQNKLYLCKASDTACNIHSHEKSTEIFCHAATSLFVL